MPKNSILSIVLLSLALCGVVYLSLPSEGTLVEMSRDDVDTGRTESLLRRRSSRDPLNVGAAVEYSDFLFEHNKAEEGMRVLADIHSSRPDERAVQTRYGMALVNEGRIEDALAVLPEARRDRAFLLAASARYEARGDLANAEAMLLAAEAGLPGDAAVWKRIARWRWDMYAMDSAADALRRALRIQPGDNEALESYFTNRVWQLDAAEALRAAVELEKNAPLDRMHLSALHGLQMAVRDLDGAAESLRKIAALPGATPEDALAYGVFLGQKGEAAKGDAVLLALVAEPDLPERILSDAASRLEFSAARQRNLALAERIVTLTDNPGLALSARQTVIDIAMELQRFDVAAKYAADLFADGAVLPEMLETGLELAYRSDDYAALAALHERMAAVGAGVDTLLSSIPPDDGTLASWLPAMERTPGRAYALAGWLKTALRLQADAAAGAGAPVAVGAAPPERVTDAEILAVTNQLLPLLDRRAVAIVVTALEALTHLAEALPDEGRRQACLDRALAVAEGMRGSELDGSAQFLLLAANVNERLGRMDAAEELWRLAAQVSADDPWSRLGLARAAAAKRDPAPVEEALRHFRERDGGKTAVEARDLVYSCLALADGFRESDPARSAQWLRAANDFFAENAPLLADGDIDTLALRADMAERGGDPAAALAAWDAVAAREPGSLRSLLGLSRVNTLLGRFDAAWDQLLRLEDLLGDADAEQRVRLAWQLFAVADATPLDSAAGQARRAHAVEYAQLALASRHDADLSQGLFWRAAAADDLAGMRRFAARQRDVPEVQAALAEALLAAGDRAGALDAAVLAVASRDGMVLLRMAYVFSQLDRREDARRLLAHVEQAPAPTVPAVLQDYRLQLADAYGGVEEYPRQYVLAEQRARAGGVPEWLDAVDRHAWAGDNEGAVDLLAEARALYPQSVELADRLLSVLADSNRPGEVTDAFALASADIPDLETKLSADALSAVGVSHDDLRSAPLARRFFRLALEKDPKDKRGCVGFARLLTREGNLGGAIVQLRRYVEGTPEDPWGWLELANNRALSNQSGRQEYLRVVELTGPGADGEIARDVRAARGVALRALGREKEALALLRGTVNNVIDDPDIACDFAEMLMEIGEYDEAERILRATAEAFPSHVWAYRLESTILVRRQKYDLAVDRLKEALAWAPQDGEVQRDLGFAAQLWERTWASQKGWLTAGGR